MTEKELIKEVKDDYLNAFNYSNYHDNKFRRKVLKTKNFPARTHLHYFSPKKNNWIMFFEARNKKEVGDMSRVTFASYFDSAHGFYVVMPSFTNERHHLIIYPPHFFKRYAERCNIDKTGVELITHFIKYNSSYVYSVNDVELSETEYKKEIYGSTADGVALGLSTEEGNILFKTFITYNMSKGEQIETFAKNEKLRKEIHGS